MRKQLLVCLCIGICVVSGAAGCGKTEEKEAQIELTEGAEPDLSTEPGTVLGEEEVVLMLEGEPQSAVYTRIQGNGDFSIAYDPERFSVTASFEELRFDAASAGTVPVFLSIRTAEDASAEEAADRYVEESDEECTVEEVTVGEGEYSALWVSYAEGTSADSRTCDVYVLRYNGILYVVQMDCFVEAYEGLGEMEQMILSTLRFYEG